jgi:hypothetical protein
MTLVWTAEKTRRPAACAMTMRVRGRESMRKRCSKRNTSGTRSMMIKALLSSQTNGFQVATSEPAPMLAFKPWYTPTTSQQAT